MDDRRAVRTRPTLSSTLSEMSSVLESSGSSSPDSSGSLLGGLDGKMLVILKEVFLRRAKPSSADNIVVFCDDDRLKTDFNKDIFLNNSNNKNVSTENVRFQNELYFVFFLFLSFFLFSAEQLFGLDLVSSVFFSRCGVRTKDRIEVEYQGLFVVLKRNEQKNVCLLFSENAILASGLSSNSKNLKSQ